MQNKLGDAFATRDTKDLIAALKRAHQELTQWEALDPKRELNVLTVANVGKTENVNASQDSLAPNVKTCTQTVFSFLLLSSSCCNIQEFPIRE